MHVTVLPDDEQPSGNAAAAEPASVNDPKLNTPSPTLATATARKRLILIGIAASVLTLMTSDRMTSPPASYGRRTESPSPQPGDNARRSHPRKCRLDIEQQKPRHQWSIDVAKGRIPLGARAGRTLTLRHAEPSKERDP
jgi:hypothetical protein